MSQIHVYGIRHHGPGCARSVVAALEEFQPEAILLEGPADAQSVLDFVNHPAMQPPVSLLIYPPNEPRQSVSFPLAEFSPEWQVLKWAGKNSIPVHLMDLPMTHRLAIDRQRLENESKSVEADSTQPLPFKADPIALLAESAGYSDHELWWEEQIERRTNAANLFAAILEAMQSVRSEFPEQREDDLLREAFMRKTIRKIRKQTLGPIAVICGAWHAPVLIEEAIKGKIEGCKVKDDTARLKGLPKLNTVATWIPWTYSRLSYKSGYGAGIESPGWYSNIWESAENAPIRWLTQAARLLRNKDLEASSASVVEASRLADAIAAIRELRSPGLKELNEAIVTVYCQGDDSPLQLIRKRLEIGDRLGGVPDETPAVPLAQNLASLQKSLRMKPSTQRKMLDLDLRKEMHRDRSFLLHRLQILGIHWGDLHQSGGGDSTFHEIWELEWQPEFAISIIEANIYGNTVDVAATNQIIEKGQKSTELGLLTELLNSAMIAELPAAISKLLEMTRVRAAVSSDVRHLMEAVLPLARIARYSDVRQTETEQILPILESLFERILVGLIPACSSLDDSAAEEMLQSITKAQEGIHLLNDSGLQSDWNVQLCRISKSRLHGLLRGWTCRNLLEQNEINIEEFDSLTRLEFSSANETSVAAAWLTGLLKGSGLLLIHQDILWKILDEWLQQLSTDAFQEMLPVLRRAFSGFTGSERRTMGQKVKNLTRSPTSLEQEEKESASQIDRVRAAKVLPILAEILGVEQ